MLIKNGDLPAMAVSTSEAICQMTGTLKAEFAGLSKREYFAAMAMQGILANSTDRIHDGMFGFVAITAVKQADALLAELERTK